MCPIVTAPEQAPLAPPPPRPGFLAVLGMEHELRVPLVDGPSVGCR
jgi:hypothetical protein